MKRWLSAMLMTVLLIQALPLGALAAAGHVLTSEELAAAYALTGFGDSGARSNAYHKGMTPNDTWNAMQVSDWLDELLDTYVYSVEDILARASIKLAELREKDPKAYARFTSDPEYKGMTELMQQMYREAEKLREELRYQRDRIEEQAALIAELGRQLKEESEVMFPSERVRLSAKVEAAEAELKAARREVADNAEQWESDIRSMQETLATVMDGAGGDAEQTVGNYLKDLYAYGEAPVVNAARVKAVDTSLSRMGRLSANGSVLSNDASCEIHVMTENAVGIQLYTGELEDKNYVKGVQVTLQDVNALKGKTIQQVTDSQGRAFFETNQFVVSDDKTITVKLDVEAEAQGYRSFGIEKMKLKLGELRKEPLAPYTNTAYVYSASFKGYDILREDFEMLYSDMNDMRFQINAVVRSPKGQRCPDLRFYYWKNEGFLSGGYKLTEVSPDPAGWNPDIYTFTDTWKRMLTPFVGKKQTPYFAFADNGDEPQEQTPARIKSIKGAVDEPLDKGGSIFNNVLGKGLSFKIKIPVLEGVSGSFDLPFKKMLPKIQIDLGGYVTISMGSEAFEDKLKKSKLNWKSQDLRDLSEIQKDFEKDGAMANYWMQYKIAYEYYAENRLSFLMESKLKLGWFALLSGRWQVDNQDRDVKLTVVKLRGAFGMTLKYSFSWQMKFAVGPVPFYVCFTLGASAGVAIGIQLGFSWHDNRFKNWQLQPLREVVVNIGFSFTAQAGLGVKGFLDFWVKFSASVNFRLTLAIMGDEKSMISGGYGLDFSAGVTLFLASFSKNIGSDAGPLFDPIPLKNALPPLQQYVASNAAAPEEITPTGQEPSGYAQLVPPAKAILANEEDAIGTLRVGTSYGHTYAFYLDRVRDEETGRTHQRVCWVDVNTGKKADAQDYMRNDYLARSRECDDYAFDVWSDERTIFVIACCANRFDDDGYPAAGELLDDHAFVWIMPLKYDEAVNDLAPLGDGIYPYEQDACNLDAALNPRGLFNPRIEWAKVTYDNGIYISRVEAYGFAERVDDGSGEKGYACFEYTENKIVLMSDMAIRSALGDDHERVNLRSSVRGKGGSIEAIPRFRCFSFVALSRPREGVEGDSAIELYDWEMNTAPVTFETQTRPVHKVTLTDTRRQAVVVKKGDIGAFEMVQARETGSDTYAQTLFYTEAETDADGAKAYKLKGLRIDNKQGALSRSLSYDVTDFTYDITMPGGDFKVQTVHGTPYIYWLSTATKQKESDPDTWRLWVVVYDPATNTVSAPAVFSEFSLESGMVPHDVLLTTEGQGYMTVTPMPKEGDGKTPPMTLYSFPLTLKPLLTVTGMVVAETTVAAGDFEDTTIALMNEGNMGISAFDLEMYTLDGDKVNVVETLHCDCLHPENSSLTMQGGGQSVVLPKGKRAIYRNDDFDYTTRQRDWVLGENTQTLKASQSSANEAWRSSLSEGDTKARYVKSNMLMPGALASFNGTLKIPENWGGDKTLYLRVSSVSTFANWQGAMANAAGVEGVSGIAANAAATRELTWKLDGDALVLQPGALASNATFAGAVKSGLIANAVEVGQPARLEIACQDIEIFHRVYADGDGSELVDIVISNYAHTEDSFKLTCAVYLDDEEEPLYVSLPYYSEALASRETHTLTLPIEALVGDPEAHNSARVVISAVGRDECAYANNEFTVLLGGNPLCFIREPGDETVQEGEDVSFEVEVGGGRQPYTYQWQVWDPKHEKWVDLPGFTGPTLSREDVEKKWDGARFRCVVTDAAGTQIVSREVTLTVRDEVPTGDRSNLPLYLMVTLVALALLWGIRRRRMV